ncbi:hypothetical protein E1A91_A08G154800v1 [Gossypium mustelinum]|uniref:Uncharacterized protein n=1 Tax=Gossypium mustelinum TaxID=34275 RepID=A0A5D2YCT3_GOSMU|nr:hypothetical protein E1A91_A08G154800v1 [Gossypium mustelinum]TYJ22891.1 hypothetical protein E1A91_A08G154800v1 [Gossypium mustelinum]
MSLMEIHCNFLVHSFSSFLLLFAGKLVISAFLIYSLRGLLNVTYLVIRIEQRELFDEFEEWHMLQGLYAKLGFPDDRQHVSDTSLGDASP